MPRDVGLVVVAAGSGVRFGNAVPKQFHLVGGIPIVLRALGPFTSHPEVAHVVLALPAAHAANPPPFLTDLSSDALTIIPGGSHRGDSVRAGLAVLRPECEIVLVHDGARPFVSRRTIDAVIGYARRGDAAVPAIPLSDTLKEVSSEDPTRIVRTRPRARLWRAQTPQSFPRAVLEQAHARAARFGHRATDDAALVEALGFPVRLVPDFTNNIKITTPEDLALAEMLAGAEQ